MSEKEAENILLELKEKAELMVDLAYSSVIYDNKKLAEEVYELENFVDGLNENLQKLAVSDAVAGELDVNEVVAVLKLGAFSEAIADAAREIADVELRDVELHPIIRESVMESEEVLVRVRVTEQSPLAGRTLGDMRLASETGMWVIAIKRGNRWMYDPDKHVEIKANDVLFVRGAKEGMEHFIALAKGEEKEI
ncbi:MAG: PhoU family transcriptional regulator [Thermoplasmata archaeon]|nr:MAG: PhoU family transcriptional regulator [Thermoplasmata archaeon]RLF40470.1 MAG: PhoU family transcriptional regulator [Thermoplasmata archaeon]